VKLPPEKENNQLDIGLYEWAESDLIKKFSYKKNI
jgi:hypothetical protein